MSDNISIAYRLIYPSFEDISNLSYNLPTLSFEIYQTPD